jgi:hypothetical protein
MKAKFNVKKYGVGTISLTGILLVIFAILGGIMGGFTGALVGILIVLYVWVISWSTLIPFAGIFIFVWLFHAGMAYILTLAPSMTGLLAVDSLPYQGLFWLETILGSIACILMSGMLVIIVLYGIAMLVSNRD